MQAPGLPTGNQRPQSRRWMLRALRVTPGSTTTEKSSGCSSLIRSIWVRLMHTPPWWQGCREGWLPWFQGARPQSCAEPPAASAEPSMADSHEHDQCDKTDLGHPLYLQGAHSPLQAGASAKWDDGHAFAVAQGCQPADLVHILGPHHSIRRMAPGSRPWHFTRLWQPVVHISRSQEVLRGPRPQLGEGQRTPPCLQNAMARPNRLRVPGQPRPSVPAGGF